MNEEARLIEQIKEVLADVEPDVAIRVIDYLTTTYRGAVKAQQDLPPRMAEPKGQTAKKPSFLHTERRIDAGEVLLEVARIEEAKKKRR